MAEIKIPGYKIIKELGHGGMATVFLAIQESFGREVAVKVMSEQLSADPTFGERFLREARIVSNLVHPHIVTVYDVGTSEGQHFLSMEYVPGEDLKANLTEIPLLHIVRVIREIASALDYAGKKGYVHRDIKPENIMIKSDDGRAILMDFGIARACDNLNGMTQTGTAIGTPYYMSPEQAKGAEVDHRSDLYSLGVVLFQLLSGKVPYSGDSAISVGIKHISEPIPELPDYLAVVFQPIVNKLMAKSADDRYQSGMSLIAAINALDPNSVNKIAAVFDSSPGRSANETVFQPVLATDIWSASTQFSMSQTGNDATVVINRTGPTGTVSGMSATRDRQGQTHSKTWLTSKPVLFGAAAAVVAIIGVTLMVTGDKVEPVEAPKVVTQEAPKPSAEELQAKIQMEENAKKLAEIGKVVESIELLENRLFNDMSVSDELNGLYQKLETLEPGHSFVRTGREKLKSAYLANLNAFVVDNNFEAANQLLSKALEAFPELSESPTAARIQKESQSKSDLSSWIVKGQQLLKAEKLTGSGTENAFAYFKKVLSVEPSNKDALNGIDEIAKRYIKIATKHLDSKQFDRANDSLAKARTLGSRLESELDKLKFQVEKAIDAEIAARHPQQAKIDVLLAQAQNLKNQGKSIFPVGQSALDTYREILAINPSDTKARNGLDDIEKFYRNEVMQRIMARNFDEAKNALAEIIGRFGETPGIRKISNILNDELSRAGEASFVSSNYQTQPTAAPVTTVVTNQGNATPNTAPAVQARKTVSGLPNQIATNVGPQILKLLVQSDEFKTVDLTKLQTLKTGRVVFVGFQYANFSDDTTLLTADLFDGGRTLKIATVPVIVKGESGQSFFKLSRPVAGFSLGSYHLDLSLGGTKIGSYQFMIEK